MANHDALIEWLDRNSNEVQVRFEKLSWTETWLPKFTDVQAELTWRGQKYIGRGTAREESDAFLKAFAEAVERITVSHCKLKNSNGVALHSNLHKAQVAASNELIERDAILNHFYSQTRFSCINDPIEFENVIRALSLKNVKSGFYEARSIRGISTVMFFAHGVRAEHPFGLIAGTASNSDRNQALMAAGLQALRTTVHVIQSGNGIETDLTSGPSLHQMNALAVDYAEWFEEKFLTGDVSKFSPSSTPVIEFRELALPIPFSELPFFVVQAVSNDLQCLNFGPFDQTSLNLERLAEWGGLKISEKAAHRLHPIS